MPIPVPTKGELQDEYISRCMSAIGNEYDTNEQAVAICINTYEKDNMGKTTSERVAMKIASINIQNEYRG